MSAFGNTMKRLRFERNMTQQEFADLLGTTKQNISRYEKGEVMPMALTAAKYAEILGISLDELNGGVKIETASTDEKVRRISELINELDEDQKSLALMFLETLTKK